MISPTFFHDVIAQTPVKVIALAGSTAVLVQLVKTIAPKAVQGNWAVALNVLVSVAGVLAVMKPENFWTETALAQVLTVAAGAAGVHGTARSWGWTDKGQDAAGNPPLQTGEAARLPSGLAMGIIAAQAAKREQAPPANGGPA